LKRRGKGDILKKKIKVREKSMKAKIYKVKAYTNEIIRGKFDKIKDTRVQGMIDYPLSDVLIIVMCSVISGLEKLEEIVTYAENKQRFLSQVFKIDSYPSESQISRILNMVNGEEVAEAIIEIMKLRILKLGDVIAVDGKAIRSTIPKGKTHGGLQILTAYFVESGVVLGQKYIDKKTNEIPVFQDMLCCINIGGKIITGDAMHCQKNTCAMITAKKGDYIFGLKGNQETLYHQADTYFKCYENTDKIEVFEVSVEKQSGRTERRIFMRILDITNFSGLEQWIGLKSIFAVKRITETKISRTAEVSYYISSLAVSPEKMLDIVRSHWKIESMHWCLDVIFSEDECRILSLDGQKTLNAFRKLALLLHKTYIKEHNLKIAIKNNMLACMMNDDLLIQLCS
jgi:predicted transposase YbfD/YdcC